MDTGRLRRELEASELVVEVSNDPYELTAKYELPNGVEIVAYDFGLEGDRAESWRSVVRDLRHGLALADQVGEMVLVLDVDEEDAKDAEAAFSSLTEEERKITFEGVGRAHEEEAERAERVAAFFERLAEFTEHRKITPTRTSPWARQPSAIRRARSAWSAWWIHRRTRRGREPIPALCTELRGVGVLGSSQVEGARRLC